MPNGHRIPGARRRVGALLGIWALLAQIALPPLHAWAASRENGPIDPASAPGVAGLRLRAPARGVPGHDADDCPVCRALVHVRHFVAPLKATVAATPQPQLRDALVTVAVVSIGIGRLPSPRAPPRRA